VLAIAALVLLIALAVIVALARLIAGFIRMALAGLEPKWST
jgi:hypothetical protein